MHILNQDLQSELDSQKRKQDVAQQQIRTLKRSYTEAQDAVGRHETDIQALQAKLASAMAEILASEEAVARMRNELKLEQERSREQEEEQGRSETTLRAQLKESEDRLREVEARLLERNQALRHLERQQALQKDHVREIQRLQERLQEVTARLTATEEGQALKDERLRNEQLALQESHERERQNLCRKLAEAELARQEVQNRLDEAEQQVEALLRGQQGSSSKECQEEILKLQEELDQKSSAAESLRESVRRLEEEHGRLTCRCQELLNQITEADREVNKLRSRLETEENDYNTLEQSYERATQEFQRMSQFLREKEEEIRQTKEMYERLVERKENDLKEALVKMAALGSSLEETEQKLQAKEELLCQMSQNLLEKVEPCSAEKDLQAKLVVAEDRIVELEQHLNALQLDYADLCLERQQIPGQSKKGSLSKSLSFAPSTGLIKKEITAEESQAKRPRIRFSSIQCQKYMNIDDVDARQNISPCESEDAQLAEEQVSQSMMFPHSSDPEKFISIIHALETKLLATEDKLRNLTQTLEEQRTSETGQASKKDLKLLENKNQSTCAGLLQSGAVNKHYAKALECLEKSREKVRSILSSPQGSTDSQLHSLSEMESDLFNASLFIRQGQKALEEQSPVVHPNVTPETLDKEALQLYAKTLSFEAAVLNKMASLMQTSKSDLLRSLGELWEDMEVVRKNDKDCLAIVYADVLTRKLMLESAFWKELERAETDATQSKEAVSSADAEVSSNLAFTSLVKAELAYSVQNLKRCYDEKFKTLRSELTEARKNLRQREAALNAIIGASKRPDLKNLIKEVRTKFSLGQPVLADVHPPELAPYMEQIQVEEARDLAEEIVERHLAEEMPSCGVDSVDSLQNAHDNLTSELLRQAAILQGFAQEMEEGDDRPGLAKMIHLLLGRQVSPSLTSASTCMREALIQAQVAYVACRLQAKHEQELGRYKQTGQNMEALVRQHAHSMETIQEKYGASLQEERLSYAHTVDSLRSENQTLRSEAGKRAEQLRQQREQLALLEERFQREAEQLRQKHAEELGETERSRAATELTYMETTADSQRKLEVLLADMDGMEERHEAHVRKLEEQFERRLCELRHLHQEESAKLHAQYMESLQLVEEKNVAVAPMEEEEQWKAAGGQEARDVDSMVVLKDRIQELETQMNTMRDELENKHLEGDVASLREKYQRDFESLKVFALSFLFSLFCYMRNL